MNKLFSWSTWSIATKILVSFLSLSIVAMSIMTWLAVSNISELGDYAIASSTELGESAISDSTLHLTSLGETLIKEKARDVAAQVELYLATRPPMTAEEMSDDDVLRAIVVQPVGETGYTTLIDPVETTIIIHRFPGQERDVRALATVVPSFWQLLMDSTNEQAVAGYYDWLEIDGRITKKYAGIVPIKNPASLSLTLWATTYIEEFSNPAEETRLEILSAIDESRAIIRKSANDTQRMFYISFGALLLVVTITALLLSRAVTKPVLLLKNGAGEIGRGNLDIRLDVGTRDELGDLAQTFNRMADDLKKYIDELGRTAADNLAKERTIQENLRLYAKNVGLAQERERKRIARELHDETVQSLVAVARDLEELAKGVTALTAADIREKVRDITRGVRRFSQELRPSVLDDLGLLPALNWLANDLTVNAGIQVHVEANGTTRSVAPEIELTLFRIVQESLNNVRKHAGAGRVTVTITYTDTHIGVTIEDNGVGFTVDEYTSTSAREGKLGVIGMKERVQLLGGEFIIESTPGVGTTVIVTLPA